MAGGHSHPDENNPTQQPLRTLPTNLLMGSLKNHLMADGTIGNLTVTGKLQITGATSSIAVGATPPTAANAGTGIWLDRTGLYSLLSNTYQVKIDATTGQLLAGGGNVTLSVNGIILSSTGTITAGEMSTALNFMSGASLRGKIFYQIGQENDLASLWVDSYSNGVHSATIALGINGTPRVVVNAVGAYIDGGLHVGGTSDPGDNNLLVDGTITATGGFVGGLSGSGAATRVAYWSAADTLTSDADMTFDGTSLSVNGIIIGRGAGGDTGSTALGRSALEDITTGQYNTAVGSTAGQLLVDGSGNTFVGDECANGTTSGNNNVAVGAISLYRNSTGSSNTVVGEEAAYGSGAYPQNISNNTVVGFKAGFALASGGNGNILLGYQAGDNITTGDNNIVIGYDLNAASATGNNQLNIGGAITSSDYTAGLTIGAASTDLIAVTGRLIPRTTASDPLHATPGSRPAGTTGEIAYYSGKWYGCSDAATPTWIDLTAVV